MVKTFEQLLEFLNKQQFPHSVDVANLTVELPSKGAPLPGNLYLKWNRNVPFVSFVHFMIENVPADRIADVEDAIVRLNNLYEAPGFGFEHRRSMLYYRMVVPVFADEGISPVALNRLALGCVAVAKEFYDSLLAVVKGRPGAEIEAIVGEVARAREAAAAAAKTPAS